MSFEIAVSPANRLSILRVQESTPTVDDKWIAKFEAAFSGSAAEGFLLLTGEALAMPLPPSPAFWRDFARGYLQKLCQSGNGEASAPILPAPPAEELERLAASAPPMRGGEFLSERLLRTLWQHLAEAVAAKSTLNGLAAWLKSQNPQWHTVGRVTFHLAENKRDPERPFAFLATYTHRLSAEGRPQHLPLGKALEEYAGAQNKTALANLLAPVRLAAERSDLVHELIESRRIFQPLAWTPSAAHRFLKSLPALEESGLLVRVPDWWKSQRPPRPQVTVRVGEKRPSFLGLDSLMNFSVDVALGGETLTEKEWQEIMASHDDFVLLKGRWVEIDRKKLQEVLAHWRKVEKREKGVSFLEGMRLLSGLSREMGSGPLAEQESGKWAEIVAGGWLHETLAKMRDPAMIKGFDPERDLHASLREYQRAGVRWLWFMTGLGLGACLADDMGLGKTIQTIALLLQMKRESATVGKAAPTLLVAPASLLANWKNELIRFAPSLKVFFAHPSETSPEVLKKAATRPGPTIAGHDLVVTTYSLLQRLPWLTEMDWRLVVLDEAQAIKNPGSRQTRAVKSLRSRGRVALTGTPIENRLGDLWSLFDFLCPGLLGSATEFGRTVKILAEDQKRHFAPLRNLTQPYILRRLKTDRKIIADLPEKTELTAWCSLGKTQAALYERSVRDLAEKLENSEGIERRGVILAFLVRLKQICNHPSHWLGDGVFDPAQSGKFARLRELAEEIGERQEKILVFTQFREMTGPLARFLEGVLGRSGLILHGSTPVKERQNLVSRFQSDEGPPFFILSLKAGGTGLNLTAASHVVHFDRWWNPAVENQATDRAFRIGQKKNVLVHKFACRGTIEERINEMIEEKKALASGVLEGGGEPLLTEMSNDELLRFVSLDLKSASQD